MLLLLLLLFCCCCCVDRAAAFAASWLQLFKATFREPDPSDAQLQQCLDVPSSMFDLLDVEDVLPDEILGRYQLASEG
jgi:hypothetical protein